MASTAHFFDTVRFLIYIFSISQIKNLNELTTGLDVNLKLCPEDVIFRSIYRMHFG